jgi:hypothetical protein
MRRRRLPLRQRVAVLLAAALCAPAWPDNIAPLPGLVLKENAGPGLWAAGLKAMLVGAAALACTGAILWWLRRRRDPAPPGSRQQSGPVPKGSRRISQKTVLLVVQWEGRRYLLAENGNNTKLLDSRAVASDTP